ncbi:MAG: hypothetical protein V4707_04110 [Pseudomonadota bacterium]
MKRSEWILAAMCGAWLLTLTIPFLDGSEHLRRALNEDAASWASALGTFLATVAALGIAVRDSGRVRRQRAEDRRLAERAVIRSMSVNIDLIDTIITQCQEVSRLNIWTPAIAEHHFNELSAAVSRLESIPVGDLPEQKLLLPHYNLICVYRRAMSALGIIQRGGQNGAQTFAIIGGHAKPHVEEIAGMILQWSKATTE